jgi:hypothetical protein
MIELPPCSKGGHDLANPVRIDNVTLSHYPWSLTVVLRGFVCLLYGLFERPRLWFLEILIRGRYAFSTPNQDSWGGGVDAWHFAIIGDRRSAGEYEVKIPQNLKLRHYRSDVARRT